MKSMQVPFFLYWRVENVQFWTQIPSAILVDWGAVFRTFLDFTKMWTRWNFEGTFLKIVHQKGLFDAIKENPNFPSCRKILDTFRQWLLYSNQYCNILSWQSGSSLLLRTLPSQLQVDRKVKPPKCDVASLGKTVLAKFSLRWNRFVH